jgi:hypothetical protein
MSLANALWAHLGTALVLAALVFRLTRYRVPGPWVGGLVFLLLAGLTYFPVGGIDLGGYVYAVTGQLSLASLALLAGVTTTRLWGVRLLTRRETEALLVGLSAVAVVFYPMALGLTRLDPYVLGFGNWPVQLAVCFIALLVWVLGRWRLALLLLGAIWAFQLRLGESDNLWDYLLDAWLGLYAVLWTVFVGLRRRLAGRPALRREADG